MALSYQKKSKMSKQSVIDLALSEVNTKEYPPNSNRTKYGEWYGYNGTYWCMMFIIWVFHHAGEQYAIFGGAKTASCGTFLDWFEAQGWTVPVSEVEAGDVVILNFNGKYVNGRLDTEHCGIVVQVNAGGRSFYTVEGNTSNGGSQSNGDSVCQKLRYPSQVVGVCRPRYKEEDTEMPKSDIDGHWSKEKFQWAIDHNIVSGYPDGTYKPDALTTRAESVTMLYNENEYLMKLIAELEARVACLEDDGK